MFDAFLMVCALSGFGFGILFMLNRKFRKGLRRNINRAWTGKNPAWGTFRGESHSFRGLGGHRTIYSGPLPDIDYSGHDLQECYDDDRFEIPAPLPRDHKHEAVEFWNYWEIENK